MKDDMPAGVLKQTSDNVRDVARCRLLYVVGQLRLGGLERQLYYLLANLDHDQYRPAVVVWNLNLSDKYYRDIEALKIPIYGFPTEMSPLSKLRALRTISRLAVPEVIHSYSFFTNFAAHYAAWGTSALAIGSIRGDFALAKTESGFIRGALNGRCPPFHISNSLISADAARCAPKLFAPREVFVVRNGLDLNRFKCADDASRKRDYVAAVGSLFPVKRWDRLLRAVQKIRDLGVKEVCVKIAGDGPLRPALEQLVGELGISHAIDFQGAIQDIPEFLRGAKFVVHTSESEGCPNAVMEAMACGLPVIAMDAGDMPYLVDEGETGFIVRQGDETALAERISQLLRDTDLCLRMGLAARVKAEREFRLQVLVAKTLEVYRAVGWKD